MSEPVRPPSEASTTKRLFTAIPISISSSLESALKRVRIGAQKREMEVNWVPPANFHVTLNFLGATDVALLEKLSDAVASVASRTAALETSLRGMGGFPDERHARVLWVGVRKSRRLGEVQESLRESMLAAGFPLEDREYVPHLTIGRMRKSRAIADLISPYVRTSFDEVAIDRIILYESVIHGSSPVYKPIKEFQLSGTTSPFE